MTNDYLERGAVVLEPLDVLFFRDGRPFDAATQAESGLPLPQTVAGALRTWLLRAAGWAQQDFGQLHAVAPEATSFAAAVSRVRADVRSIGIVRFRGPWFVVLDGDSQPQPLVRAPATLLETEGRLVRLDPLREALPGWEALEPGMLPLWHRSLHPGRPVGGWLTRTGLERFLAGGVPDRGDLVRPDQLFGFDRRTGISVHPDRFTASEGLIYGVRLLALRPGVGLYVELEGPPEALELLRSGETALPLGGEGRCVRLHRVAPAPQPAPPPAADGPLVLVTAPAFCPPAHPWRPAGLQLVAAGVPGYVAVSGWDLARGGPKPTRFAVEAGSVYYLGRPLSAGESLATDEDAAVGWGTFVEGSWNYV